MQKLPIRILLLKRNRETKEAEFRAEQEKERERKISAIREGISVLLPGTFVAF